MTQDLKYCINCGGEIKLARLKIFPNTNICSAKCVEILKNKDETIFNLENSQTVSDKCPKHKINLVQRIAKKSGEIFYGCPKYPKCFYRKYTLTETKQYPSETKQYPSVTYRKIFSKINNNQEKEITIKKPIAENTKKKINSPNTERIWGSARNLTEMALNFDNQRNINEIIKIRNEFEFRINKRISNNEKPTQSATDALAKIKGLLKKY